MSILRDLLGRLGPRGVGVIHFPFQIDEAPLKRWARWAYNNVPYSYVAANLIRGQKPFAPPMFMHRYSLYAVVALLSQSGCERIYAEVMKYGRFQSLVLMFQKASPGQRHDGAFEQQHSVAEPTVVHFRIRGNSGIHARGGGKGSLSRVAVFMGHVRVLAYLNPP